MIRKGIKPIPIITYSEILKDSEFAFAIMTINKLKKCRIVACNNKKLIINKAERKVKNIKTIDIKIIKKYDKIQ